MVSKTDMLCFPPTSPGGCSFGSVLLAKTPSHRFHIGFAGVLAVFPSPATHLQLNRSIPRPSGLRLVGVKTEAAKIR